MTRLAFLFALWLMDCAITRAATSSFEVSPPKTHTEVIDSNSAYYSIEVGGTVDMENTTTRGYPSYTVAFQPNVSLEIENTGKTPVIDPWILINDQPD